MLADFLRWIQLRHDYPEIPSGIALDKCIEGEDWLQGLSTRSTEMADADSLSSVRPFSYSAETSFDLPISSDTLLLIARGTMSGSVDIKTSSDIFDVAKVDISMKYFRKEARQNAKACLVRRKSGENGVGIFVCRFIFSSATFLY